MILSPETCIKALGVATMNRKLAFQLELSVGLAMFLVGGGATRSTRSKLNETYAAAGYRCATIADPDYKTVNRRINATAMLYEKSPVAVWVGEHNEEDMLRAVMLGIEPYELFTVVDVQRYCNPPQPAPATPTAAHPEILTGPAPATGQQQVISMFKRAAAQVAKGARHIETEHLALMIPDDTPREELIEMASKLLELSKELLTA